jgi:hypothetical protein
VARQNTAAKRSQNSRKKLAPETAPNRFLPIKGYVDSVDDTPKTADREGLVQRRALVLEVMSDDAAAFSRQVTVELIEHLAKLGKFSALQIKARSANDKLGRGKTEEYKSATELAASLATADDKQFVSAKFFRDDQMVVYVRAESYLDIPAPPPYDDRLVLAAYFAEEEFENLFAQATFALARNLSVSVDPDFVGEPLPSLGLVRRLFDWAFLSH